MVEPYLKNPLVWVCPKRLRGLTYTTAPGVSDPTVTGFLSYGFNDCGCFCQVDPTTGVMKIPTPPLKLASVIRPSQLVCVSETSGLNDPTQSDGNGGGYEADAAWFDSSWATYSGPTKPYDDSGDTFNGRLQTAYGKHMNRVNILYTDGHAAVTLASQLTWGGFFGVYGVPAGTTKNPIPIGNCPWNSSISTPALDSKVWNNSPE
jgi:prepilin-type processing-associated H-X9-DG protein